MIGEKLSPILEDIEKTLWEFELHIGGKPDYSTEGFRAATKIFMSAFMDKMWELQEKEDMSLEARKGMVENAGKSIRALIKVYTSIDCHDLYQEEDSDGKKGL